jgi:drug/metabolite transporter (DMT)-like permease
MGARSAPPLGATLWTDLRVWQALVWNAPLVLGLLAWAGSTALWVVVLNRADLSYAYMLGSLNYVLVPLAAHYLFGETLSTARLAGMALIVAGVLVVLYERGGA